MRRLMSVLVAAVAAAAFTGAEAASVPAPAAAARTPVIFVHGLSGGSSVLFKEMIDKFRAAGWTDRELIRWDYDWKQSNFITADQFAKKVDQVRKDTKAVKVDIVAHSMGSLPTRHFIKSLGGAEKTAHWVSIGGVNHGTVASFACFWDSCADMRQSSKMLKSLNAGDETPGAVKYQTQSSSCDEIALPHSTVPLAGARNIDVGCLEHILMPKGDKVITQTIAFLTT
ncbi:esterase/lipase family protein [Allokutzneria oryzae]|uniref:Esterase/lipase family protein n=1 Tax=Allokutzneria oryzae TaxID=1378989 RepID=A0ABV6A4W7_9PSEU